MTEQAADESPETGGYPERASLQTVNPGGAYRTLAASYDALMLDADYFERVTFLEGLFREAPFPVGTVLDLGCGTGTVAWLLAERGYRMIGVDASEEMLSVARGKAAKFPGDFPPPLLVCQSMERLDLGIWTADAAISTLDAMNYLTREQNLRETFRRVFRALRPGGRLIFDVNTPYKFSCMDEQMYMDDAGDTFCVWRTFFSPKTRICTYQVDLFRKRWDGAWDRSFEEHRERAWSEEQLRRFLLESGFARVTVTGDLSRRPPKEEETRWIILAEKAE